MQALLDAHMDTCAAGERILSRATHIPPCASNGSGPYAETQRMHKSLPHMRKTNVFRSAIEQ